MNQTSVLTWYEIDQDLPQLPTAKHVLVELDDNTMVSGNFCAVTFHAGGKTEPALIEYFFAPDVHGSDEKELAASVGIEYISRWTFYPEAEA